MTHRTTRLLIYLLLLLIVSCSTVRSPAPPGEEASSPTHQTTLIIWHAWPSPNQHTLARLIDHYNQTHTHTHIVPQAFSLAALPRELRAAALAGSGPHLVLLQSQTIGSLAHDGILLPIDTLLTPDDYAHLLPTALDGARVQHPDGTTPLYGLPLTFDTLALYYDKSAVETPPTDINTLLDLAHRLTSNLNQPDTASPIWGLAYTLSLDKTIGYLPAFGGAIFDAEGNLVLGSSGRDGTEQWLEWLTTLRHDPNILAVSDSITVDSALKARKALMTIDWSHALPNYQALWGNNLGVAALPNTQPAGASPVPPTPYIQSTLISINARVETNHEQQAALDFMRYLASSPSQQVLLDANLQPALLTLDLSGNTPPMQAARVFRAQAQYGQAIATSPLFNDVIRDELERMHTTVLRGLANPADAVTHADAALRERLHLSSPTPPGTPTSYTPTSRLTTTPTLPAHTLTIVDRIAYENRTY